MPRVIDGDEDWVVRVVVNIFNNGKVTVDRYYTNHDWFFGYTAKTTVRIAFNGAHTLEYQAKNGIGAGVSESHWSAVITIPEQVTRYCQADFHVDVTRQPGGPFETWEKSENTINRISKIMENADSITERVVNLTDKLVQLYSSL